VSSSEEGELQSNFIDLKTSPFKNDLYLTSLWSIIVWLGES